MYPLNEFIEALKFILGPLFRVHTVPSWRRYDRALHDPESTPGKEMASWRAVLNTKASSAVKPGVFSPTTAPEKSSEASALKRSRLMHKFPQVGDLVMVLWEENEAWYPGRVISNDKVPSMIPQTSPSRL